MQRLLQKLFGIYPGEGVKSLRFVRLAIFWALGITILETLSDGLFLEKIGAKSLPSVFLISSLSMILVSTIVLYALKRYNPYKILITAIAIGGCICAAAALILTGSPPHWFWFAFKISSRMLFAVLIACSWTFIDQYHDLQDAKRVYSLYSAAYFLGNICSGTGPAAGTAFLCSSCSPAVPGYQRSPASPGLTSHWTSLEPASSGTAKAGRNG